MNLYCTKWIDDAADSGSMFQQKWSGTQAQAKADRKTAKDQHMRNVETVEVSVPTSKAALIDWLNQKRVRP